MHLGKLNTRKKESKKKSKNLAHKIHSDKNSLQNYCSILPLTISVLLNAICYIKLKSHRNQHNNSSRTI